MFLVNSRFPLVSAAPIPSGQHVSIKVGAPLLPKLRGHFAEFLNHNSLDRLSILYLITCVGLGYGRLKPRVDAFLGSIGSPTFHPRHVSAWMSDGFAYRSAYTLAPGLPSPGLGYLPASHLLSRSLHQMGSHAAPRRSPKGRSRLGMLSTPGFVWAVLRRYGNINPLSIDYACRPRLRSRLTQGRLA